MKIKFTLSLTRTFLIIALAICLFQETTKAAAYCQPVWSRQSCSDLGQDYFSGFQFSNINDANLSCPATGNYIDSLGGTIIRACTGNTYVVSCVPAYANTGNDEFFAVAIDFNNNGSFSDPGEFFYLGYSTDGSTVTGSITIPSGVGNINTRLRVICQSFSAGVLLTQNDVCGDASSYGEAIDYAIHIRATPVVTLSSITQCGGTVGLDAQNAGSTYIWSNGSTNEKIIVSASGTYTVTVTNASGCSATGSANVYINPVPSVYLGPDKVQCGGPVTLDAGNPGDSYSWNTGQTTQTIQAMVNGLYSVTVTDNSDGCSAQDTVGVIIFPVPVVNLGPDTTQCGGSVVLDAGNSGAVYAWSNGLNNEAITVNTTGNYTVTVTDSNHCSATASVLVTIEPVPVVTISFAQYTCVETQPFALYGGMPLGGTYYENDSFRIEFNPRQEGIGLHAITYMYTNNFGCTDSAREYLVVEPQPFITTTPPPPICSSSSAVNLNLYFSPPNGLYSGRGVSGNYLYGSIVPPSNDTIVDIYTDVFGCSDTSILPFEILPAVRVSLASSKADFTICNGQDITFTGSGADDYQFFVDGVPQGNSSPDSIFTTNSLNNHDEVIVVGNNVCSVDTSEMIVIDVLSPPTVSAGPDTTINLGQKVQLYGNASGDGSLIFQWDPSTNLNYNNIPNPIYSGNDSVTLWFIATDNRGCTDSAKVTIDVAITPSIQLPNIITPDGDGFNDVWKLNPKIDLDGSHLVIFNRWGETVFETENYANNWGGTTSSGKKLPDGTYYYVLKVPSISDHVFEGPINILSGQSK